MFFPRQISFVFIYFVRKVRNRDRYRLHIENCIVYSSYQKENDIQLAIRDLYFRNNARDKQFFANIFYFYFSSHV